MAPGNDKSVKHGGCRIILLILLFHMLMVFVDGRGVKFMKNKERLKQEGTVKIIESDDGDMIDCVDIKKQPALNHPLLKNHTIRMKPHVLSGGIEIEKNENTHFQSWRKNGECPEGSIPILRTRYFNNSRLNNPTFIKKNQPDDSTEFAILTISDGNYFGTTANIDIWNPVVTNVGELSAGQMWIVAGNGNETNTIETGWMVHNGENQTRFFVSWTSDNFRSTGCYNLDCSGFVQTTKNVALGAAINPVSTYGGQQYVIVVKIQKEKSDGNWWLKLNEEVIGYWPSSIFTHLAHAADVISWGGDIINERALGRHTSTQMGSGHFADEGPHKASFFTNLGYSDDSSNFHDPQNLKMLVTNSNCYNLMMLKGDESNGVSFCFGGPGFSEKCP